MPYAPSYGAPPRPPTQPPPQERRFHVPVLSAGLVVLYLIYVVALVLAPYFIEPYGKAVDGLLSPLLRLIGAMVLLVLFAVLMVKDMFPGEVKEARTGPEGPQMQRAAPLGGGPPIHEQQPRFTPVAGPSPPTAPPPQTFHRTREIEKPPSTPSIFTYPQEVEGGIYGDTYVQITPNKIVRIRSLVVDKRYMS